MRPDRGGFINACRVLLDSRAVRHGSQAGGERTTSVRLSFLYKTVEQRCVCEPEDVRVVVVSQKRREPLPKYSDRNRFDPAVVGVFNYGRRGGD